ncbi:DUF2802 domain-containing protein [Psychrosphaera haliotis]|uniref:DUF2802 domain-containing protein n=1 Tax=Psychrosphaera haliotis TaxID=555083 RepID=UPI00237228B6|nr:DUF2802 domain-containing protein [Psychrosphaera haliotis]
MMVWIGVLSGVLVCCVIAILVLFSRHRQQSASHTKEFQQLNSVFSLQGESLKQIKQKLDSTQLLHSKSEQHKEYLQQLISQLQTNQQQQLDVITELSNKILMLEQNHEPNPLYTRAKKMIELGAELEEVIQECEISRAEAELLIAMQKQTKTA